MTLRRCKTSLLPLSFAFAAAAALSAGTAVTQLTLSETDGRVDFSFVVSRDTPVNTFLLSDPLRAVVDLPDAALARDDLAAAAFSKGPVNRLRHGRQPDGSLRLVLDLEQPAVLEGMTRRNLDGGAQTVSFRVRPLEKSPDEIPEKIIEEDLQTETVDNDDSGPSTPTTFVFGNAGISDATDSAAANDADDRGASPDDWNLRLHRGLVESGALYDSERPADALANLQFIASVTKTLGNSVEIRLGARIDGQYETGGQRTLKHLEVEYDESWLRYRADDWRFTVGTQKIIWGRSDEIAPTDRLSTQDFTRLLLDSRADRRRANPALRLEWFGDNWNADLVWLPIFREGELPERDSLWYPVDSDPGRILGLPDAPVLSDLAGNAQFNEGASGDGGGGIRLNRFGRGIDYAFSVQRVRNSQPYFRLDESLRQALLSGTGPLPGGPPLTFDAVHPRSWVLGADAGLAVKAWTLRMEAAWSSDMPVTRENLALDTVSAWHWLLGAETFPGDGDLRLTVQLAGMQMQDASDILDQSSTLTVLGEITTPFASNRWRAGMRYWVGIEQDETYLNPELVWTALEPHEFYLGAHLFDGKSRTIGGFYEARDMIVFGWRGRF